MGLKLGQYKDYALLGDDIVIGNRVVADKYLEVMNGLGVEINDAKSHRSSDYVEFAKNSFIVTPQGIVNVSGVPLPGIVGSRSNMYEMTQQLQGLCDRGILRKTDVTASKTLFGFVRFLYNYHGNS